MSDSFYTIRKDTVFAQASTLFKNQIVATPLAFGLTAGLASNYASLDGIFQSALTAVQNPLTRTPAKIATKNEARANLKQNAAELASLINGTASVTTEQKMDLGIAVRATPTPMPALGQPNRFKCAIDAATGALELTWKNTNPRGAAGAVYQIWRQIGTGTEEYLGGVGGKKYTDDAVPTGASQVTYKIQAVRSTSVGPFATFVVKIGTGGSTTVTETTPVKLAA